MCAGPKTRQAVALFLVCTFAWGCSTSAAVERRSGPTMVGRIDGSDA